MNIGIFRNTALRFFVRSTEERGENPRRRNGTVNVGKEAFGAKAQPLAKKRGRRKQPCGKPPQSTKSGYSVPISTLGFPKGAVCSA